MLLSHPLTVGLRFCLCLCMLLLCVIDVLNCETDAVLFIFRYFVESESRVQLQINTALLQLKTLLPYLQLTEDNHDNSNYHLLAECQWSCLSMSTFLR